MPRRPRPLDRQMPSTVADEPAILDDQLGLANAHVKAKDGGSRTSHLAHARECEKRTEWLAVQILRGKSALLDLFHTRRSKKIK
jgi:hypothetical protein